MAMMPFEPARENVRFGSKADIGKGATDLRFTLKADIARRHREAGTTMIALGRVGITR